MRRDIHIDTNTGDVVLRDQNKDMLSHLFQWKGEDDTYVYGQVILPSVSDLNNIYEHGVKVEIPYTPIFKPIQLTFVQAVDGIVTRTLTNPVNLSTRFDVYTHSLGKTENTHIKASQLLMINNDGNYIVQLEKNGGNVFMWSGALSDLEVADANIQNRNLMLMCVPSNNYRYPTSGVGLVRYLHGNLDQTDLANRLDSEFKADKVSVNNASFDSYTGDIDLDLDFTEANAEV